MSALKLHGMTAFLRLRKVSLKSRLVELFQQGSLERTTCLNVVFLIPQERTRQWEKTVRNVKFMPLAVKTSPVDSEDSPGPDTS